MSVSSDDTKYAVLSPLSVQACADMIGISGLPDDVLKKLAEDASYRVREIASKSCEFMRYSKRKKLKSVDVDRALHWSRVQPIHGSSDSLNFNSNEGLCYHEDSLVDLKNLALSNLQPVQRHRLTLHTEWFNNDRIHGLSFKEKKEFEETHEDGNAEKDCNGFELYYTSMVECVLSDNEALFVQMLNDLKCNPRVAHLISYLTTFVSGANLVSHDLNKLSKMLSIVKALLNNDYISVQLYLKPLLKAVLYCILEPLTASINPLNDHWMVRDYGAFLSAQLVYSYAAEAVGLLDYVHSCISDILLDPTKPLCSHYGALILLAMLGKESIKTLILPNFVKYIDSFLQPIIDDSSNVHMKMDAQKVFGACIFCIEKLHYDILVGQSKLKICYPSLDIMFNQLFGDSLVVRLPLHDFATAPSKSKDMLTQNNDKPNEPIPWPCYSLCSQISEGFLLKNRKKHLVSDFFYPVNQIKQNKPIQINFGNRRPVQTKNRRRDSTQECVTASSHQLQLVRRIFPSRRNLKSSSVYSFI